MPKLLKIRPWPVAQLHNDMSSMLHPLNTDGTPEQNGGVEIIGCDPALSREPWAGCSLGIRAPEGCEIPLSVSEVEHYLRYCND